jgi:hypothetical protein
MQNQRTTSDDAGSGNTGLEPLGDPDDDTGDFAGEHDQFVVEGGDEADGAAESDDAEPESPGRYAGGLDREGPP